MRILMFYWSCILSLICVTAHSKSFQVIEKDGQLFYVEQPWPTSPPSEGHAPGITLSIPKGIKAVKTCADDRVLIYPQGQYILIRQNHVDDTCSVKAPEFVYKRMHCHHYDEGIGWNKTKRGRSWYYYRIDGIYATLDVAVKRHNVKKFLAPIVGNKQATLCSASANDRESPIMEPAIDFRHMENHPGKKFSRRYIVHQ